MFYFQITSVEVSCANMGNSSRGNSSQSFRIFRKFQFSNVCVRMFEFFDYHWNFINKFDFTKLCIRCLSQAHFRWYILHFEFSHLRLRFIWTKNQRDVKAHWKTNSPCIQQAITLRVNKRFWWRYNGMQLNNQNLNAVNDDCNSHVLLFTFSAEILWCCRQKLINGENGDRQEEMLEIG